MGSSNFKQSSFNFVSELNDFLFNLDLLFADFLRE